MKSQIYHGQLRHRRLHQAAHEFTYPLHLYALPLDDLGRLERESVLFGHNRLRPLALHDRDYLHPGPEPLMAKVERVLADNGLDLPAARVILVTALRQFHYVFNPVSFFFCYDPAGQVYAVLVQVNNTFGDTHLYALTPSGADWIFAAEKCFHVSPFFPRRGRYRFHLCPPDEERLSLSITYFLDENQALVAGFEGRATPLTAAELRRTLLRHPLRAALTFPRILSEAARLWLGKRLPIFARPEPDSIHTLRHAPPGPVERLAIRVMSGYFSRLGAGSLTIRTPDGRELRFGDSGQGHSAVIDVRRHRFFTRAMLAGDIGFGEAYVDGDWTSPDLLSLLCLLSLREESVRDRSLVTALLGRALNFLTHLRRDNTPAGSRRNIHAHYDLGNDLYALFLDPTMSYSSAIFLSDDDSLERAQERKMSAILDLAGISAEDRVLEIGCGWGGFALEAVRRTGCRLTGITVSRQQHDWALARVRDEGLEERIDIRLADYRHVRGSFTRIVSIEMIEAVGHRHLPGYFAALDRLLAPGGRVVLQAITMAEQKYLAYRRSSDWIRKHIFPGGHLPSIEAMTGAMGRASRFGLVELRDIGRHYIPTLEHWRTRFLANRQQILGQGFDESFVRKWDYYFRYCQAGFRNRLIRNVHAVLERTGEPVEEGGCRDAH